MKIIIIGAEAAGSSAAAKAKRVQPDATVTVYEKTDIVSFGACGLPYFIGNQFNDENEMVSRTPEQFIQSGINMHILHEVIAIDQDQKKVTVRDIVNNRTFEDSYDKLLITVGASPVIPPLENIGLANIFTIRNIHDGLKFKAHLSSSNIQNVAIVGGGYIGLELAEALVELGKKVKVFQLNDRVLAEAFDKEITDVIETELHRKCDLHLNEIVQGFKGTERVEMIYTNKGMHPTDVVIISTGVRPNSQVYKSIGLEMLGNDAIIIDEYGQTNLPDIYAAGDCASIYHLVSQTTSYIPLATSANKIGRIVGENLVGGKASFPGTLGTSALRIFDLEAGRTGLTEEGVKKAGIPYKTVFVKDKNHSNYIPGQAAIYAKVIYHAETREMLGGQLVGSSGAVLRANVLATAIWKKTKIDELAMMDFLYAPPFSRPWDILNLLGSVAK